MEAPKLLAAHLCGNLAFCAYLSLKLYHVLVGTKGSASAVFVDPIVFSQLFGSSPENNNTWDDRQ